MTAERRKALLMMGATFVIGIIIGVLATGILARQFYHGRGGRGDRNEMHDGKRGTLTDKIFKVVKADSNQRKLMKPIIDQTISRLDEVEEESNQYAYAQIDSLKIKLRPLLNPRQAEKLDKFLSAKRKEHEEEEKREYDREHGRK